MNNKRNFLFGLFSLVFTVFLFSLGSSATGCCQNPIDGNAICSVIDQEFCSPDSEFAESSLCEETIFCQKGCCYKEDIGLFSTNTIEALCEYEWDDDPNCNIPQAELGCCFLGTNTKYETRGECTLDTESRSLGGRSVVDWDPGLNEIQCTVQGSARGEGACIAFDGGCSVLTAGDCFDSGGQFNEGYLCSSEVLNTGCEPTEQTTCVDGKDEVYFLDSCGNTANVYDSSRIDDLTYWSLIISAEESCEANDPSGNGGSTTCGNCDRFAGGICSDAFKDSVSPDSGEFYCRPTECIVDGTTYESGESWCTYEGKIGDGDDIVGAVHALNICNQGVVDATACKDYRNEVCVQKNTLGGNGTNILSRKASCEFNPADSCFALNQEEDGMVSCEESLNCLVKSVSISSNFKFDVCIPQYPKGFDLEDEEGQEKSEDVCGYVSQTCKVLRERNFWTKCEITENRECLNEEFIQEMNTMCRSVGDCGLDVNIAGITTTNLDHIIGGKVQVPSFPPTYISTIENLVNGVPGQFVELGEYNEDPILEGLSVLFSTPHKSGFFSNPASYLAQPTPQAIALAVAGDCDSTLVEFHCKPWTPPIGGDSCEVCNGPERVCTPYECNSLGASCDLINRGSSEEICLSQIDDGFAPTIDLPEGELFDGNFLEETSTGFKITGASGACLPANTFVKIPILTNEEARCKYSTEKTEFVNMGTIGGGLYVREHSLETLLPDPSHGVSQGLEFSKDVTLYIKCEDIFGHVSPTGNDFLTVELCIEEGPDTNSPIIYAVNPENEGLVGFHINSTEVSVVTNELSTCRWSEIDTSYDVMDNSMECTDGFGRPSSSRGYVCTDTLPVNSTFNEYYIKCSDQPWLDDETSRNENRESYLYTLSKPASPIVITGISPSSDLIVNTASTSVDLQVSTNGGSEDHQCAYSLSSFANTVDMFNSGNRGNHKQPLNIPVGDVHVYIKCIDLETGEVAKLESEFEIKRDTTSPQIARVWQDGSTMTVVTNEPAECVYTTTSCRYSFEDGTSIGNLRTHDLSVERGRNYYIKCQDDLGNYPTGCSINVLAV